jgi:hypothetical protein
MKKELGADFEWVDMPREEILADQDLCLRVGLLEHVRWNAYMRTEGYSYGEITSHLYKKHNCLVSVVELIKTEEGREILRKDV